jgi:Tfp pilus assembly protein PilF
MLEARERIDSAATILNADYLLTGRVYVSGGRQEIQMALRKPRGADTVWRATFRSTTTPRAVENAIVSGVSIALSVGNPTTFSAGWPTTDVAHDAILAGDVYLRSTTRAGADSAMVMYELALDREPQSPVAAARLARAYMTILQRGGAIPQFAGVAGTNRIFGLTTQALAADSTLADAWTVRAMLARLLDPVGFEGAVQAHRRAVALAPTDAEAEHEFGVTLMRMGDARGAEARFRRALTLEPSRASTFAALSEMALRDEQLENACALSNASIGAWPFDPMPYAVRAQARLRLAEARDAYADAEMVRRLTTGAWTSALRVIMASGASNVDVARRQARELTAQWLATGVPLSVRDGEYLALAYLSVGDQRRAIESLRRAEPIGADLGVVLRRPALSSITSDTAVVRLLRESAAQRPQGTQ